MDSSLRFIGHVLVISLGLAVLELISFVGISNMVAIPFTLFGPVSGAFFRLVAVIMGFVVLVFGVRKLCAHHFVTGTSVLTSIGWAVLMSWMLMASAAFTSIPSI